jgi:hypothetical protein
MNYSLSEPSVRYHSLGCSRYNVWIRFSHLIRFLLIYWYSFSDLYNVWIDPLLMILGVFFIFPCCNYQQSQKNDIFEWFPLYLESFISPGIIDVCLENDMKPAGYHGNQSSKSPTELSLSICPCLFLHDHFSCSTCKTVILTVEIIWTDMDRE